MTQSQELQTSSSIQPTDLLIRRMKSKDVPGVMVIESVSFGTHHWSSDSFINEMNNQLGRYYALVNPINDDEVVGYCGYWVVLDEVHVTTVAVHPKLRGKSLGEVQLVHILDRVMGQSVNWVTLEVRSSNHSAQNLYYKYGFRSVGLRPKYYQDNREDALVMTTEDIQTDVFRQLFEDNKQQLINRVGPLPNGLGQ